ncbi:MAG TPA: hypothetical protein PLE74_05240 [Candidatus Cloacimonadota bacterium]|nr:hypothetical protein [Candidatus Cloacimonadota bacterium]HPT71666.1 hypothetical protein [Candidatus Cloacimonadota bacterium]
MYDQLKSLEANPLLHYKMLNEIYADMLLHDPEKLETYNIFYLCKFTSLSDYVITKLRDMMKTDNIKEHIPSYLYLIMAISLFSNHLDTYNQIMEERSLIDVSETSLELDFKPINKLITLDDSEYVTIQADDQADIDVCRFLTSGLAEMIGKEFPQFFPKPHVFLLRGKGSSPYNKLLNCAFLMIGHYQGTEYEKKIFSTSVPHELIHLVQGTYQKVEISKEIFGIYKFFDEGLAVQNSYSFLTEKDSFYTKFSNSAYLIHKYTNHTTLEIMEKWEVLSFQEGKIPTYDYACAFMNYLDSLYPSQKAKDFFRAWLSQTETPSITEYFESFYHTSITAIDQRWKEELDNFSPSSTYNKFTRIKLIASEGKNHTFQYTSECDLWSETCIFCIYQGKIISKKPIDSNGIRYSKNGCFSIETEPDSLPEITFIVLFQDNVEVITPLMETT